MKSKEIICPICKENIRININNYKIRLFECKNGHIIKNILLNEFENSQYINELLIKCDKCNETTISNSYNKIFFKCNLCKINLCPLCKSNHDYKHNIINYELKNYICDIHNGQYIGYCQDCKKNICKLCLDKEEKHDIIYYNKIIIDKDKKVKTLQELRKKIDRMNEDINNIIKIIISKLKMVMDNI